MKVYLPPSKVVIKQLENSRRWRDTNGESGARFYLAFEQLPDIDLEGAVFFEATLQDAGLTGTRLNGADFGRSLANGLSLDNAQCIACNFNKAELVEASFRRAVMCRSTFRKANLRAAKFDESDLREADFEHALCNGASFRNADLRGTRMMGALIERADFTGAVLDTGTCFSSAIGIEQIVAEYLYVDGRVVRDSDVPGTLNALTGISR